MHSLHRQDFQMHRQIVIGLILGIFAAYVYPDDKSVIPTLGNLFVKALKAVAPILVFVLVASAIAKHQSGQKTSMKPIIVLYFVGMLISGGLALTMSYIFPSTFTELAQNADVSAPSGIGEVLINFVNQSAKKLFFFI